MKTTCKILSLSVISFLCSCSGGNSWHLEGKINNIAEGDEVIIEANNQGYWYPLDTLSLSSDGSYKYSYEAQGYPDIFRLRIGGKSVYFPVDSIESIRLNAEAPDIDLTAEISGSPYVDNFVKVDSILMSNAKAGTDALLSNADVKRELTQQILADPSGIIAYYIINKTVGGKLLYDPAKIEDLRIIGAVANAFNEKRPNDPRTGYLKRLYLSNRRGSQTKTTANVAEVRAFDINLFDNKGKKHSLLETTSKGNVVILNFTAYTAEESPALNLILNQIYQKYHSQGLEIFQVSFDSDEPAWREAAKNLPWITVYNDASNGDKALRDYNVGALPAIFIFDRQGNVVERVAEINSLESSVAARM